MFLSYSFDIISDPLKTIFSAILIFFSSLQNLNFAERQINDFINWGTSVTSEMPLITSEF